MLGTVQACLSHDVVKARYFTLYYDCSLLLMYLLLITSTKQWKVVRISHLVALSPPRGLDCEFHGQFGDHI